MLRPRVVLLTRRGRESLLPEHLRELDRVAELRIVQRDGPPGPEEAARLLAGTDLLGATNLCLPVVDAALLDRLPRLRGVVLYATGYDHLDVSLLASRGVGLSVLPDYATGAVAEHGLAMLLGLATRLHLAHDRSRGAAPAGASLRGVELGGRTLGVVGLGRIGGRLAGLAAAIGMRVVGTDPDPRAQERARAAGIAVADLDTVLGTASAVAVCASAAFGAAPLLGARELALLPAGCLLVNVSRSSLVDTGAAVAAVRSGRLRGYAVDDVVLDPAVDGDVLEQGRVLQTGHSAWWRDEVLERGARMWGERLLAAAAGRPVDAVTWPDADRPGAGAVVPAPVRPVPQAPPGAPQEAARETPQEVPA